jgi:hypothetical protein
LLDAQVLVEAIQSRMLGRFNDGKDYPSRKSQDPVGSRCGIIPALAGERVRPKPAAIIAAGLSVKTLFAGTIFKLFEGR